MARIQIDLSDAIAQAEQDARLLTPAALLGMLNDKHEIALIEKLKDLPPGQSAKAEDFCGFLTRAG